MRLGAVEHKIRTVHNVAFTEPGCLGLKCSGGALYGLSPRCRAQILKARGALPKATTVHTNPLHRHLLSPIVAYSRRLLPPELRNGPQCIGSIGWSIADSIKRETVPVACNSSTTSPLNPS